MVTMKTHVSLLALISMVALMSQPLKSMEEEKRPKYPPSQQKPFREFANDIYLPHIPEEIIKKAEEGNADAQYVYAKFCLPTSIRTTLDWLQRAADQGHVEAQFDLGELYYNGNRVVQDYSKAREYFRTAADLGSVAAQLKLGYIYGRGLGIPKDALEAVRWYQLAAEAGNLAAIGQLEIMYMNGDEIDKEYQKAFHWCQRGADKGDRYSLCNLGLMYSRGDGVEKDEIKAFNCFQRAADMGDKKAQFITGRMYIEGESVGKDVFHGLDLLMESGDNLSHPFIKRYLAPKFNESFEGWNSDVKTWNLDGEDWIFDDEDLNLDREDWNLDSEDYISKALIKPTEKLLEWSSGFNNPQGCALEIQPNIKALCNIYQLLQALNSNLLEIFDDIDDRLGGDRLLTCVDLKVEPRTSSPYVSRHLIGGKLFLTLGENNLREVRRICDLLKIKEYCPSGNLIRQKYASQKNFPYSEFADLVAQQSQILVLNSLLNKKVHTTKKAESDNELLGKIKDQVTDIFEERRIQFLQDFTLPEIQNFEDASSCCQTLLKVYKTAHHLITMRKDEIERSFAENKKTIQGDYVPQFMTKQKIEIDVYEQTLSHLEHTIKRISKKRKLYGLIHDNLKTFIFNDLGNRNEAFRERNPFLFE